VAVRNREPTTEEDGRFVESVNVGWNVSSEIAAAWVYRILKMMFVA